MISPETIVTLLFINRGKPPKNSLYPKLYLPNQLNNVLKNFLEIQYNCEKLQCVIFLANFNSSLGFIRAKTMGLPKNCKLV